MTNYCTFQVFERASAQEISLIIPEFQLLGDLCFFPFIAKCLFLVKVILFWRHNFLRNHNRKRQEKFEIRWKGKSLLLMIFLFCIKPYWLAYKSSRYSLSLLEWIFSGHKCLKNGYPFSMYSNILFTKLLFRDTYWQSSCQNGGFFKLWKKCKRDYAFSEICWKYTFIMGHPNIDI